MGTIKLKTILTFLVICVSLSSQDVDLLPCDPKDNQPVILGVTSRDMILKHRTIFSAQESAIKLSPETVEKLEKLDQDLQVIVAFGSWCSDTHHHLPGILALDRIKNPHITITYLGAGRSKQIEIENWPSVLPYQFTTKVPSIWVFRKNRKNLWTLKGSIIEHPSDPTKTMSDELLEILSK